MIRSYLDAAMRRARYEMIEDEEPSYGEVPELMGVWASGKTLEDCRNTLAEAVEGWILIRLSRGLDIPPLDGIEITPREMAVG